MASPCVGQYRCRTGSEGWDSRPTWSIDCTRVQVVDAAPGRGVGEAVAGEDPRHLPVRAADGGAEHDEAPAAPPGRTAGPRRRRGRSRRRRWRSAVSTVGRDRQVARVGERAAGRDVDEVRRRRSRCRASRAPTPGTSRRGAARRWRRGRTLGPRAGRARPARPSHDGTRPRPRRGADRAVGEDAREERRRVELLVGAVDVEGVQVLHRRGDPLDEHPVVACPQAGHHRHRRRCLLAQPRAAVLLRRAGQPLLPG